MTTTQPTDRRSEQAAASQTRPASVVGLEASANIDAAVSSMAGKLPEKPQTLKTFTIDLDDAWTLP